MSGPIQFFWKFCCAEVFRGLMLLQWTGLADNWARVFQFSGLHLQEGERWSSGSLLLHQCVIADGSPK